MTTPKAKLAGLVLIAALCAAFTLGLTAPAWAGFDEGVAAYKRGDYATAIREWRPLAEQGDAGAQYNLGQMYRRGQGVPKDYVGEQIAIEPANSQQQGKILLRELERKALEQLASEGDVRAQTALGDEYYIAGNFSEAAKWYQVAAAQGEPKAQTYLGAMYKYGEGVPQDYVMAARWYRAAAEQDFDLAQLLFGIAYAQGKGVPRDLVLAYMWLTLTDPALLGPISSLVGVGEVLEEVAKDMTPDQIAEAEKLAREWRPKT